MARKMLRADGGKRWEGWLRRGKPTAYGIGLRMRQSNADHLFYPDFARRERPGRFGKTCLNYLAGNADKTITVQAIGKL